MRVLIVDKDELSVQMIGSRLSAVGWSVLKETIKNDAVARLDRETFDAILIDPSPLNNLRPIVVNMRRAIRNYPYIIQMGQSGSAEAAIKSGANDFLEKPVDPEALMQKMKNAERFTALVRRIGDDSEDFPSAGGVIAKSAFKQLFLSAIDRADRYGEKTYILFIGIGNYQEILQMDGRYAAEYAVAKLSQKLVLLRRQSDIIGQTAKYEYALLLQRPAYETEPVDAANRFAETLGSDQDWGGGGSTLPVISIRLVEIPVGSLVAEHTLGQNQQA